MVSVFFDASGVTGGSGSGLDAVVVLNDGHSRTAVFDVHVASIGHDGIVLMSDTSIQPSRHAWVEVDLPGEGRIRPLVRLDRTDEGRTWGHITHIFPADRARLSRFEAAR